MVKLRTKATSHSAPRLFPRVICLALAVFLAFSASSCQKADPAAGLRALLEEETADAPAWSTEEARAEPQEDMLISWGYSYPMYLSHGNDYYSFNPTVDENTLRLADELGRRFGVTIAPTKHNYNFMSQNGSLSPEAMPDVFIGFGPVQDLLDAGTIRTIPMSMIKRHAPRYADALLRSAPALRRMSATDDGSHVYGLLGYNDWSTLSYPVSIYRMDWLERIGAEPNGTVQQVADRIYFTDQPFGQDMFFSIMRDFSCLPPSASGAKRYGLVMTSPFGAALTDYRSDLYNTSPLLGMWGLGPDNVAEDGKFAFTVCSERYRHYLSFIQQLAEADAVLSSAIPYQEFVNGRVGWTNEQLLVFSPFNVYNLAFFLFQTVPEAKILITPPEIGVSGQSGAYCASDPFTGLVFYANAKVSDAKLAVILQVFEALSYEKEVWLRSMYGEEGTDWEWEGEPERSRIAMKRIGMTVFRTNVTDASMGDFTLDIGLDPAVTRYVRQNGERLAIRPHKEYGDFDEDVRMRLDNFDPDGGKSREFFNQATMYLARVAAGETDVNSTWDEYINGLREAYADGFYAIVNGK